MMSLSTILLFTWFIVPYFYLADFVGDLGYEPSDASTLLSVIGITNTIGMVSGMVIKAVKGFIFVLVIP